VAKRRKCGRCYRVGPHLCVPRVVPVVSFFERILVHTKGRWARSPFILSPWQRDQIIRPLFGEVEFDEDYGRWIRRYRIAWLELARKNGKSELLAGIALVLLVADDEEGAEVYSAAADMGQARKVYDVAERMVELSPALSRRIQSYKQALRLVDSRTASYYEVIASDALSNLGHNPHGVIIDEVISQPDARLWEVLRTGMGTREQPMMLGATTAGNDASSFAYAEHAYSERVARDPALDPRRFVFMRNTTSTTDPFDEAQWAYANPALGDFLSINALRDEAREARNDPVKLTSFLQYRLNMWVQAATRWMPLHLWDACAGPPGTAAQLDERARGQRCFGGLDLSSKYDLTALCWLFPDLGNLALWRFWLPEEQVPVLDRLTGGLVSPWVEQGWIRTTPGATIDYDALYLQVDADRLRYRVVDLNYDPNMAAPVIRELEGRGLVSVQVQQGFAMSEPMKELMRLVQSCGLVTGGNPVARWNAECVEVKQDDRERIYYVKPRRGAVGKRIDGIAALVMAVDGVMRRGSLKPPSRRVVGF
jgi:phage terminase large subunit-like protein